MTTEMKGTEPYMYFTVAVFVTLYTYKVVLTSNV